MGTLYDWLHAEPFTLTMSSGFFGFFAHCGMLSALEERGLTPARITGSSAGALVGACFASGCPTVTLQQRLAALQKKDFWDPRPGLGLLRGNRFRTILRDLAQVTNLEDCPIPIAVSVYDGLFRKTKVMDTGPLDRIVSASCAVPFLFHPVRIGRRWYWDGGIRDRHGLAATQPGERIFFHHLSSRSPWRHKNDPALKIPQRENLTALVIDHLPRSGPNRLEAGPRAFERARQETFRLLRLPIKK